MADTAAVQFLLDNLGQLAEYHFKLISGASEEVKQLTNDLTYFHAFLRYASNRNVKDDRVSQFVRQIREAVYDAEDILDAFITQTVSKKSRSWLQRLFKDPVKLDEIAQKVRRVMTEVSDAFGDKSKVDTMFLNLGDDGTDGLEIPLVREKNVVGLQDAASEIIGLLKEETPKRLDIISIVGMPGLGKSTLAGKIIRDPIIQYEFPTRLWVYVSKFTPKDVFLSILREFTTVTDDMRSMAKHQLAEKVKAQLGRGKFLIVMDDVWSPEEWKEVSAALPIDNHLGKILITTRNENVATSANKHRPPHNLRLLNKDETVELLQYEVFGEPEWEPEFKTHGEIIAHKCNGLPLSIVVVGGIIGRILSEFADKGAKVNAWEKFSLRVPEYINEDPTGTMNRVINLSYKNLPYHLRPCFLYFGMFPEDIEIPTRKLFLIWIAEGFIQENKSFTLEETAESYLKELIRRNLVKDEKKRSDGTVKTCRIHDSLHEFCKAQAGNENFYVEICKSKEGFLGPSMINDDSYRRLCIHSNVPKFIYSKPSGKRVRSFVCFSKENLPLDPEYISALPGGFKLLRVLDVKPIKFPRIPSDMCELLHLRHIHLSFNSKILPKGFNQLWNMQTLIVETAESTLEIKADIWKMRHLRHMKTNVTATLPEPTSAGVQEDTNLQTLGIISHENCTDKVINRACNLRRVSIRGKLHELLPNSRTGVSFAHMVKLSKLEKLKLHHDVFPNAASDEPLPNLPPAETFPPNLRILTLSNTFLDWSRMKALASLDNLEVLKLKEKAFMGNYLETLIVGFRKLNVLFIGRTDLVVWKTSADNFPKLSHLELENCDDLREVPNEFARNLNLNTLILSHCRTAGASGKTIRDERMKVIKETGSKTEFKLTIFPPIN